MLCNTSRISLAFNSFRENPKKELRAMGKLTALALGTAAAFLKSCYVDGFSALVKGEYSRRQATVIIAGNLPTILGALFITVPEVLFPLPGHHAYYYFGSTLGSDPTSLIPITLGAISSTLGLRIPLA